MPQRTPARIWFGRGFIVATAGLFIGLGLAIASDHQDTPEVELHPRLDINDVYLFPSPTPGRIVLALNTSSPITPAATAGAWFDPSILYQIKIDNTGDAIEDLVLQFTFDGDGPGQVVNAYGPAAPVATGTLTRLLPGAPALSGAVRSILGGPGGVQLFAGPRDDSFFLDLEQFFRILPDRAPVQGPLSKIGPKQEATAFRPAGQAIDYLAGLNTLSIVVELPVSALIAPGSSGSDPRLGVWATTSR